MTARSGHARRAHRELELWYALGRLYSRAESAFRRATRLGVTVTLISGAALLLSVPLFGVFWIGPFAPAIPAFLGLAAGFGMFGSERATMRRRETSVRGALSEKGLDARRPARFGLSAYYDAQLILLRSEYEYLLRRGAGKSSRLFEDSFGFTPEDSFETGPLNVLTDTEEMAALRERWDRRLSMRRERGIEPPEMGLREDRIYGVFPREMTVSAERATREAYLSISRSFIKKRYGRDIQSLSEESRKRVERDLTEYDELTGRATGRPDYRAR